MSNVQHVKQTFSDGNFKCLDVIQTFSDGRVNCSACTPNIYACGAVYGCIYAAIYSPTCIQPCIQPYMQLYPAIYAAIYAAIYGCIYGCSHVQPYKRHIWFYMAAVTCSHIEPYTRLPVRCLLLPKVVFTAVGCLRPSPKEQKR